MTDDLSVLSSPLPAGALRLRRRTGRAGPRGATIETAESVDDIDAIRDVPGMEFVFIGSFEPSVSVGPPRNHDR